MRVSSCYTILPLNHKDWKSIVEKQNFLSFFFLILVISIYELN